MNECLSVIIMDSFMCMYHVNKYMDILLTEKKIYNIEQTINDDDDGNESIFTVKYNEQ